MQQDLSLAISALGFKLTKIHRPLPKRGSGRNIARHIYITRPCCETAPFVQTLRVSRLHRPRNKSLPAQN